MQKMLFKSTAAWTNGEKHISLKEQRDHLPAKGSQHLSATRSLILGPVRELTYDVVAHKCVTNHWLDDCVE